MMNMRKRTDCFTTRGAEAFSIAFTTALTEASDNPQDWIAKKGNESVFAVLSEIFPQARCQIFCHQFQAIASSSGFKSSAKLAIQ